MPQKNEVVLVSTLLNLWNLVDKLKFRKMKSKFQRQLNEDIRIIKRSNKVLIFADETLNIFKLDRDEYKKNKSRSMWQLTKRFLMKQTRKLTQKAKEIWKRKTTLNRMFVNGKNNCFITLKNHKANFLNNTKTRLSNLAKNEFGRVSEIILDKINLNI